MDLKKLGLAIRVPGLRLERAADNCGPDFVLSDTPLEALVAGGLRWDEARQIVFLREALQSDEGG